MRLPNLKRISRPSTVEEAGEILADPDRRAAVIAGGITFFFGANPKIEELVSIGDLGLDFIRKKKGALVIGAGTKVSSLLASRAVAGYAGGLLAQVARHIGSTLNRNLISVGGNIMQPFIWCDLPTVLLALGGTVVTGGTISRRIESDEFFARHPRQQLKPGELVVEVEFPPLAVGVKDAYLDFSLTENDFALIKIAGLARLNRGVCRDISLVVGGATALPQRLEGAERILLGKKVTDAAIEKAAAQAAAGVKLVKDIRCSSAYKRNLVQVLANDILRQLLQNKKVGR